MFSIKTLRANNNDWQNPFRRVERLDKASFNIFTITLKLQFYLLLLNVIRLSQFVKEHFRCSLKYLYSMPLDIYTFFWCSFFSRFTFFDSFLIYHIVFNSVIATPRKNIQYCQCSFRYFLVLCFDTAWFWQFFKTKTLSRYWIFESPLSQTLLTTVVWKQKS